MPRKSSGEMMRRDPNAIKTTDGDNSRALLFTLAVSRLPKIDTRDPIAVENRVMDYYQLCAEQDMKPSVPGLALALGVSRGTIRAWLDGRGAGKVDGVQNALEMAYTVLTAQMEQYMLEGKINPIAGIFLMRNNLGYSNDDTPLEVADTGLNDGKSAEEIAKEYENLPD